MIQFNKIRQGTYFYILLICFTFLLSCKGENDSSDTGGGFLSNLFSSESLPVLDPSEVVQALDELKAAGDLSMEDEVQSFYAARGGKAFWTTDELRKVYLDKLSEIEREGLHPEDYRLKALQQLQETAPESPKDHAHFEILLSDSFLNLAHDLYYGKLDPVEFHWIWDVERDTLDIDSLVQSVENSNHLVALLDELRPNHQVYQGLIESLAEIRVSLQQEQPVFDPIPMGEAIEPGDKDPRIPAIAARLQQLGLLEDSVDSTSTVYSPELEEAITNFQKSKHMAADGIIGKTTLRELNMTLEDRYRQVLVNLERWRWYPRDLGQHYIMINIPQYQLAVVKDGDTIKRHNVIAGTRQRQTPIFSDQLDHIVLNPTWTLPPTIKAEDVLPKAASDPSYFTKNDMVVSSPQGDPVDPSTVDWSSSDARNYVITQRPGATNPLGRVKIMYPNQYSIYLHDTPAQGLFERSERAASSGCVRVEDALDLAQYVVQNQPKGTKQEIDSILKSGKTTNVSISQPIKVYHFYWTAWREGGETIFTEDVYAMDQKIAQALLSS